MGALLSVLLFAAVVTLVIWQPRGLSVGWPAAAGGLLAVLLRVVPPGDVLAVVRIVWDPTLTFVALVLISLVLDSAGFFEWAALHMARAARGSGWRLFIYSVLLGAMVSAFFANDGAVLILTPILYEQVRALRLPPASVLAFVMAGGFVADATSLPLVVSNLVNILSADYFHVGFAAYAARMLPVDMAALAASLGMLALVYRRDIPRAVATSDLPDPASAIRDARLFRFGWLVLALLAAGYLASHPLGLPVSAVAGGAAVALVAMAWRNPELRVPRLIAAAPWHILVFSVGMYVVVFGLGHAGLIALVGRALAWAAAHGTGASVLTAGYLAAGLSSIMNNLPAVLLVALGVGGSGARGAPRLAMALGNVIGSDVGPKMTPIGSLGTLLWLHVLERRGLRIGWGYYVRVGLTLTLPVLTAALLALWAVLRLQRAA